MNKKVREREHRFNKEKQSISSKSSTDFQGIVNIFIFSNNDYMSLCDLACFDKEYNQNLR